MTMEEAYRQRLIKVIGMLGSSHDGERAAAALLATQLITRAGLTWNIVAERAFATPAVQQQAHQNQWKNWRPPEQPATAKPERRRDPPKRKTKKRHGIAANVWVEHLLEKSLKLTEWERGFLRTLAAMGLGPNLELSDRQWQLIEELAEKCGLRTHYPQESF